MNRTPLEKERLKYRPQLPDFCRDLKNVIFEKKSDLFWRGVKGKGKSPQPLKMGVLFSGGPAPGGHNVICALFESAQSWHKESMIWGFLKGPQGLLENKSLLLTEEIIAHYRNLGGFDMIGSGRTKIEKAEQFEAAARTVTELQLDGLVIIGGDDSNTNAAFLAEDFIRRKIKTRVIGVPKTIDGDLGNEKIALPFGFDTATKVYSEIIGNMAKDALSTKKYTHFVKLMGRAASHVTLECALQTQPNLALIGEEIQAKGVTLHTIVEEIANLIEERSRLGKHYGIILIPEGLIEFIPECRDLIKELNEQLAQKSSLSLSEKNQKLLDFLPPLIQKQLLSERDPHGNVQLSHIETEKLLITLTQQELERRSFKGSFHPLAHFFGYEGRSALPSNFDLTYCTALGYAAFLLIKEGYTSYLACIEPLTAPSREWMIGGMPLRKMMHEEERKGKRQFVIAKKLVDLEGGAFRYFSTHRTSWRNEDHYLSPGPIQFLGESSNLLPKTLFLQQR